MICRPGEVRSQGSTRYLAWVRTRARCRRFVVRGRRRVPWTRAGLAFETFLVSFYLSSKNDPTIDNRVPAISVARNIYYNLDSPSPASLVLLEPRASGARPHAHDSRRREQSGFWGSLALGRGMRRRRMQYISMLSMYAVTRVRRNRARTPASLSLSLMPHA